MNQTSTSDTIVQEIAIHAPAERIFKALVDPDERVKWWGRGQFRATRLDHDLRPGGHYVLYCDMSGTERTVRGVYRTIEPPSVLEFTWLPDWYENPSESVVRFDLMEDSGVTTVRITHSGLVTQSDRQAHGGWPYILASLKEYAQHN